MSLWALPSFVSVLLATCLAVALILKRNTSASLGAKLLPVLGILVWIHGIYGIGVIGPTEVLWNKKLLLVGELLLPVTLGYVSLSFYSLFNDKPHYPSLWWWRIMGGIACFLVGVVLMVPTSVLQVNLHGEVIFIRPMGQIIWGVILISLVVALSQFEQILRGLRDPVRYQLKFMLIGLGGIAGIAIAQASQILLLPVWNSTFGWINGVASSISLGLLGFGLGRWRLKDLSKNIRVSHQVFYSSLTFLVVGAYFISVYLFAGFLQKTGWELREALVVLAVFVSALFLVVVKFSRQTRFEIQQFIARHFFQTKYDYREKWLEVTETFSSCRDIQEIFDRYLQWLILTFGASRISIWKRFDANGQFHQIRSVNTGNPPPPIHDSHPLLGHLRNSDEPIFLDEALIKTEGFYEFFQATQVAVCVPIGHKNGHLIGFCSLSKDLHGRGYDHDDLDLLRVVAHHVAMLVRQFQLQEGLIASEKWEAVHKFSGFYLHDLKNLASSLSMVAQNADVYGHDPEFQISAMRTIKNTTQRIMELMNKLASHTKAPMFVNGDQVMPVDLNEVVSEAIQGVNGAGCKPAFHPATDLLPVRVQKESISQLVLNLVLNAGQAMGNQGEIHISTALRGDCVVLEVVDTGPGMSSEQVEHLFEPFRSTKKAGLGVGLFQCKRMVEDLNGTIRVESEIGKGTKIIITFPLEYAEKK